MSWSAAFGSLKQSRDLTTVPSGFAATPIESKLSMRAFIQCEIERSPYGIIQLSMGAAWDSFEAGLLQGPLQFDKPLVGYQLTQKHPGPEARRHFAFR